MYQLKNEIIGNSLEKVGFLDKGKEEVVSYAWANAFWEAIQSFLLFQLLCFKSEAYMR